MNRYLVIHNHDYGSTNFFFESERDLVAEYNDVIDTTPEETEEWVRKLGIDFEYRLLEGIDIIELGDIEFTKI